MTKPSEQAFTYLLRVRYSECDAQGVVFNGRYAEYVDIAATEFTRKIWGDYQAMLKAGYDSMVVNLNISWQAPAHFDDVLSISVALKKIGTTSYTLKIGFKDFSTNSVIANAQITYVLVKTDTSEKVAIPTHLRQSLELGAPSIIVNHAGVSL